MPHTKTNQHIHPDNQKVCNEEINVCVNTDLAPKALAIYADHIKATLVDRRNPNTKEKPLMLATDFVGMIQSGENINLSKVLTFQSSRQSNKLPLIESPSEITIKAKWISAHMEQAQAGSDASVFGSLGVLEIDASIDSITLPYVNALQVPIKFLQKYGAELIPVEETFQVPPNDIPELQTLFMTEYTWSPGYIQEYVMHPAGGGGLFVETHPFPHVFIPLEKSCGGALILGKKETNDTISFTALEIPYGYAMKIDSYVIHGDSFFTGRYAIALNETDLADSVLIKTPKLMTERELVPVSQINAFSISFNPIILEHQLANRYTTNFLKEYCRPNDITSLSQCRATLFSQAKITHKMNVQSILDNASKFKAQEKQQAIEYFKSLPLEELSELRHLSGIAQEAYDQSYALTIHH